MLLSDRDLVSEIKAGDLALEPFEPALMQPSSIDVRLDRLFRVQGLHKVTGECDARNVRSAGLMERLGFTRATAVRQAS